ncbi:MAG: beta strand repeat-containing protein, partial [Candidatus Pristimantibacillus sp.]
MMNKRKYVSLFIVLLILLEAVHPVYTFAAWSKPDFQMSSLMHSIARGPDRFVAIGDNGKLSYSLDGSGGQFSGSTVTGTSVSLNGIIYDGSKYVIVGANGTILMWAPGEVLETPNSNTTYNLSGIAYGGGKYVATGQFGTVVTSSDGVTWTSQMLPNGGGAYIYDVTYGDKFVAVGQHGKLWTSLDGVDWTEQTSNTANYLQAVTYGNGQYVAVGAGGAIITSPNGVTWTVQTSGITQGSLLGVTYGDGRYVAVGNSGIIVTSNNGISWDNVSTGITDYLSAVEYGNNTFTVVGNNVNLVYENSTVIYDGNSHTGGTVPSDNNTYATGTTATVLGNTGNLMRTGYTFTGWNTAANGSGTSYAAGATLTMGMANVTLYAQWTANPTYKVLYNGNGSTGGTAPTDSGTYETGASATVLGKGSLLRTGYMFAGWNTAANGSGTSYTAGATLTMGVANVTLYAQWTANPTYKVLYNGNGNNGGTVPTDSGTYETGTTAAVLGNTGSLVRAGYTFTGWNTAANGSGTSYAAGATLTMGVANVTLYAQWTANPTYKVLYNGNGSTGGTAPTDSGTYETGATATVLGNTGSLVRTGYAFTGWNTAANGSGTSYAAGATLTMGVANVTLYAQWTANPTYKVTYNGNGSTGGTAPTDSGTYETGASATVLGNSGSLVRTGYMFAGWNTAANGSGTSYAAAATLTMGVANVTLYAQWTANPTYKVLYNGNGSTGGTAPTDSGTYETGTTATVVGKGSLVRTGYTFTGWNTAANGSGTSYATGATLTMGVANVTLYAQWTANPTYKVLYNGNGSTGGTMPTDSGT